MIDECTYRMKRNDNGDKIFTYISFPKIFWLHAPAFNLRRDSVQMENKYGNCDTYYLIRKRPTDLFIPIKRMNVRY